MKHPTQGGRILLEREAVEEARVSYRVSLFDPEQAWSALASMDASDGSVDLSAWEGQGNPPPWLEEAAHAFLRTLWSARRKEGDPSWPRRVLRWRAPREG